MIKVIAMIEALKTKLKWLLTLFMTKYAAAIDPTVSNNE
jgi:hypothetical protein